jgi:putative Mg2+ transporter-C (MgtC) family protein
MDLEPLWRMLLAAGLTVPIGLERELRGKAAGLRTHVVVGTASAAFALVSLLAAPEGAVGTDQTRIAAQVVSGIGFMGAGVIFASGGRVHGLTTAAALWGASAIGVCVGLRATNLAISLTLVLVLFLWPVDWLSDRLLLHVKRSDHTIQVIVPDHRTLQVVQDLLTAHDLSAYEFEVAPFSQGVALRLILRARVQEVRPLLAELRALDTVALVTDPSLTEPNG